MAARLPSRRADAAAVAEVLQLAYAAVGHLPAQERGPYEGWLQRDGLAQHGQERLAMVAVGSTVVNRMRRNGSANVRDEWGAYRHGKIPSPAMVAIAQDILDGRLPDPTNGATHFYSPGSMMKETDPNRRSSGRMLESVPDVVEKGTDVPVRNERPAYSLIFEAKLVPGIPERLYKFYKQPEDGRHVR